MAPRRAQPRSFFFMFTPYVLVRKVHFESAVEPNLVTVMLGVDVNLNYNNSDLNGATT